MNGIADIIKGVPLGTYKYGDKVIIGTTNVKAISIDGKENRIDFLFVVTPTNITAEQMRTEANAAKPYLAFRYRSWTDCQAGVPQGAPLASDTSACPSSPDVRFDYKPVLAEMNANPNAPANDPMRFARFPVCVLQKDYP
jgi:hypothetical protein